MNEAAGGSSTGPLGMMDQHERKGGPESGVVTNIRRDLQIVFGKDNTLIDAIDRFVTPLRPMMRLIHGDKPTPGVLAQGRGMFPLPDVYIKGIGSVFLLGNEPSEGDIRGFPKRGSNDILFDPVHSPTLEPRVIGTLSMKHALIEYGTGLVVAANTSGVQTVEDFKIRHLTIPIGVTSFPQLTERMQNQIHERISQLSDTAPTERQEKEFLSRQENLSLLGSIGLVVPSNERIGQFNDSSIDDADATDYEKDAMRKSADQMVMAQVGTKLRELLDMGFVYVNESAHGQNMYIEGTPADLGDLVSLGDCKDSAQREMLIYQQLSRNAGLMPLAFPRGHVGVGSEVVAQAQTAFWENFLHGIASEEAIRMIPQLMPSMSEQIFLAAAKLLTQRLDHSVWEHTARQRRKILEKYKSFGTITELDNDLLLTDDKMPEYQKLMNDSDSLGVTPMGRFLETGDAHHLTDPRLSQLTELSKTLASVADPAVKNRLLEAFGNLHVARYVQVLSGDYDPELDPLSDKHFSFINNLIKIPVTDRAEKLIEQLTRVVQMPSTEADRSQEKPSKVYFANKFLGRGLDDISLQREFAAESKRRYISWQEEQ